MKTIEESPYRLTKKQMQVLGTIVKGHPEDGLLDMDQLLEAIPYETSKNSIQFTIRSLITRKMIVKMDQELRRGRMRVVYAPTLRGQQMVRDDSSGGGVIIEGEDEDDLGPLF
ncbi:MAG: hypothetical protein KI788_00560 [Mameliella sp.]|nr:hypothetical protein [Mameliella sp.]